MFQARVNSSRHSMTKMVKLKILNRSIKGLAIRRSACRCGIEWVKTTNRCSVANKWILITSRPNKRCKAKIKTQRSSLALTISVTTRIKCSNSSKSREIIKIDTRCSPIRRNSSRWRPNLKQRIPTRLSLANQSCIRTRNQMLLQPCNQPRKKLYRTKKQLHNQRRRNKWIKDVNSSVGQISMTPLIQLMQQETINKVKKNAKKKRGMKLYVSRPNCSNKNSRLHNLQNGKLRLWPKLRHLTRPNSKLKLRRLSNRDSYLRPCEGNLPLKSLL